MRMNTENGHLVTRGKILSTDLFNWSQILSTDSLMECMEVTQKNLLVDIGAKGVRVKWYTSGWSRGSLRSKRFQSSYCAKVRAEAKKRLKGEGEGRRGNLHSPPPSPSFFFFFCSCPSFLDEPREETPGEAWKFCEARENDTVNQISFYYLPQTKALQLESTETSY